MDCQFAGRNTSVHGAVAVGRSSPSSGWNDADQPAGSMNATPHSLLEIGRVVADEQALHEASKKRIARRKAPDRVGLGWPRCGRDQFIPMNRGPSIITA